MARTAIVLVALLAAVAAACADDVITLTTANFKDKVIKGEGVWMVEFYAPWCGHCKNLAPEWAKAATALKGVVNVAAVDATVEEKLAKKFGIQGFPTIKIFGANKSKPTDYAGGRTANEIVAAGLQAAQDLIAARTGGSTGGSKQRRASENSGSGSGSGSGSHSGSGSGSHSDPGAGENVVKLTSANFAELVLKSNDMWLVEFYAPWCGHCKNLAPEWAEAATQLKGQVKVGAVDATEHSDLGNDFKVQGYPTIKVFPPGKKTAKDAMDWNGPREASGIVDHALRLLSENGSPVEVPELTSAKVLEDTCSDKQVCIIAFLPHILDSSAAIRNKQLEMLQTVATKKRSLPFKFLWTQAGNQPAIEEALHMNFGFPSVVAISRGKQSSAIHTGTFDEAGIGAFVQRLMMGKGVQALKTFPEISTVEPWDGKDGVPPTVDDEDL